jgi:hypothetical protein
MAATPFVAGVWVSYSLPNPLSDACKPLEKLVHGIR